MITCLLVFGLCWICFAGWVGNVVNDCVDSPLLSAAVATCIIFLPMTLLVDIVGALK